ncbi:MAG: ACP S-malonyltransferase [candidate division KSB1 bacterium]|nr:ACP S-malonyltransferase [candidate division KSB1 bacterium]MDZ7272466.1 ACP S-malonyltransferase [candidate division KSB1 bacterium]MDZ7284510.1 ACP S-malonyltransferase [candidate division KSB1 bacterium]MDZ7297094.1 ACP S-malonyltransferase [candidate division KSB1 bacterium]MDZ7306134.1 ACP S-malonyltransferase [candidate division KSB1 bacterium]
MHAKIAFLFPGQASQFVGMARDLHEAYPVARDLFRQANEVLGFDIAKVCFAGPLEELTRTSITQPAILIHSVIVARLLQERGMLPAMAAGHSLGEYSALVAAQALSFEEALRLVKLRGELMEAAGRKQPGTMAAIMGLAPEAVDAVCRAVTEELAPQQQVVQAANFNSHEQTVISGHLAAVEKAMALAKQRGAKLAKLLVVGGAFHSPLMAGARQGLQQALRAAPFADARCPIYTNVTARPEQAAAVLRERLEQQLTSPVNWVATIENMIADGAQQFYEVGPGKVLAGLLKRINKARTAITVGTVAELQSLMQT